ncbi:hypothetical protein [Ekhidna sp. To15]|uniref:hypothetical protein n=1 Tax=Ekhidna sp. To15 TaxID=3395267 RepID=UPI003F5244A1
MKRVKIGDMVESDYGKGRVLAETKDWIIHDNSANSSDAEFAILKSDDHYQLVKEMELQTS